MPDRTRAALELRWLMLTRETMPAVAGERGWPIVNDHCFQRVLLDNACGRTWYDVIGRRPAYRHAATDVLACAVELAVKVMQGTAGIVELNRRSLAWRGKR